MSSTILITGANGQLGSELREITNKFDMFKVLFTDVAELDITDTTETTRFIKSTRPDWIINCAGYTAVDRAESEPRAAEMLNGFALRGIVDGLAPAGGRLIHISTDFVFNGRSVKPYSEDDMPDPLSVYGMSKLSGEKIALTHAGTIVIRTSWLYSVYGNNFVKTILRLAKEKESINVVNDQVGSPTYASDLAGTIMKIISTIEERPGLFRGGIYNYSNEGSCSWYEFAMEIRKMAGLDLKIIPVTTDGYPLPAKRPAMSVLDISKIKKSYGIHIPLWQKSLEACIEKIKLS